MLTIKKSRQKVSEGGKILPRLQKMYQQPGIDDDGYDAIAETYRIL